MNYKTRHKRSKSKSDDITIIIKKFFLGFLIPFLAINGTMFFLFTTYPTIIVDDYDSNDYNIKEIKFQIKNKLPISNVEILLNETTPISYNIQSNKYVFPITDNGSYKITATSINKTKATTFVDINELDNNPPTIDSESLIFSTGTLSFNIQDNQSGINYENVYIIDKNNEIIKASYVDKDTGLVQFAIDSTDGITIHIEDMIGNSEETNINIS